MTVPTPDPPACKPLELTETPSGETDQATKADDDIQSSYGNREAQLKALRSDVNTLRTELAAIAAGGSRLVVLEANAVKQIAERRIRHHLLPALVAAGVVGQSAFFAAALRPQAGPKRTVDLVDAFQIPEH
jgi:hypothetical protein